MKQIKITKKLLLPVILSVLFGVLFLVVFVYKMSVIEDKIHYLETTLVPSVEKSATNIIKLQNISENFVFSVLASELDMLPGNDDADIIDKNLRFIVHNSHYSDSIIMFRDYFTLSMQQAKDIITHSNLNQKSLDSKALIQSYNAVQHRFEEIHLYFKNKIVWMSKDIHTTVNELIYFTILFIVFFSLFILGISYFIYKDFNDKFSILKYELENFNLLVNQNENVMFDTDDLTLLSENVKKQVKRFQNLKREKHNIENIVNKDHLTGLYNRRYLQYLENEFKTYRTQFSIIMLDIDYFKRINDTYGHDVGDAVLVEFAHILEHSVRSDDVVIRYGGEEFVILMRNMQQDILLRNAETIKHKIETFRFSKIGNISASFGLSSNCGTYNIYEVIKNADKALYQAKEKGRNRVILYEDC